MSDYIDRQVALDALGVTKNATKYGGDHSGYDTRMLYEIHDALTGIPAADVAPVVFCKDCRKRRKDGYCTKFIQNISGIASVWYMPQDDDFCSYGERREG